MPGTLIIPGGVCPGELQRGHGPLSEVKFSGHTITLYILSFILLLELNYLLVLWKQAVSRPEPMSQANYLQDISSYSARCLVLDAWHL